MTRPLRPDQIVGKAFNKAENKLSKQLDKLLADGFSPDEIRMILDRLIVRMRTVEGGASKKSNAE